MSHELRKSRRGCTVNAQTKIAIILADDREEELANKFGYSLEDFDEPPPPPSNKKQKKRKRSKSSTNGRGSSSSKRSREGSSAHAKKKDTHNNDPHYYYYNNDDDEEDYHCNDDEEDYHYYDQDEDYHYYDKYDYNQYNNPHHSPPPPPQNDNIQHRLMNRNNDEYPEYQYASGVTSSIKRGKSKKQKRRDKEKKSKRKERKEKASTTHTSMLENTQKQAAVAVAAVEDTSSLEWVQCEKCKKWRKLAPGICFEELPDVWYCSMNTWNTSWARCDVPQEMAVGHQDVAFYGDGGGDDDYHYYDNEEEEEEGIYNNDNDNDEDDDEEEYTPTKQNQHDTTSIWSNKKTTANNYSPKKHSNSSTNIHPSSSSNNNSSNNNSPNKNDNNSNGKNDNDNVEFKEGKWSKEEREQFFAAYKLYGSDWKEIAEYVGTRSRRQCLDRAKWLFERRPKRYQNRKQEEKFIDATTGEPKDTLQIALEEAEKVDKADMQVFYNEGKWTKDEREQFLSAYKLYGSDWKKVSEHMGTRSHRQCMDRAAWIFKRRPKREQQKQKKQQEKQEPEEDQQQGQPAKSRQQQVRKNNYNDVDTMKIAMDEANRVDCSELTKGEGLWTKEEHETFLKYYEMFDGGNFKKIAECMGTRSARQVRDRANYLFKRLPNKKNKTNKSHYAKDFEKTKIPATTTTSSSTPPPTTSATAPILKLKEGICVPDGLSLAVVKAQGLWTKHEEDLFSEAYDKFGNQWRKVALHIGTRTARQCVDHYHYLFKRMPKKAQEAFFLKGLNKQKEEQEEDEKKNVVVEDKNNGVEEGKEVLEDGKEVIDEGNEVVEEVKKVVEKKRTVIERGRKVKKGRKVVEKEKKAVEEGKKVAEEGKKVAEEGKKVAEEEKKVAEEERNVVDDKKQDDEKKDDNNHKPKHTSMGSNKTIEEKCNKENHSPQDPKDMEDLPPMPVEKERKTREVQKESKCISDIAPSCSSDNVVEDNDDSVDPDGDQKKFVSETLSQEKMKRKEIIKKKTHSSGKINNKKRKVLFTHEKHDPKKEGKDSDDRLSSTHSSKTNNKKSKVQNTHEKCNQKKEDKDEDDHLSIEKVAQREGKGQSKMKKNEDCSDDETLSCSMEDDDDDDDDYDDDDDDATIDQDDDYYKL